MAGKDSVPIYNSAHRSVKGESIDAIVDNYQDRFKPASQKKITKTISHDWSKLYKGAEKHFEQFGRDDDGELKYTSHEGMKNDSAWMEHLLIDWITQVGLPRELGETNAKNIRASYEKMRKTGKVSEEYRAHHRTVKDHVMKHFGKIGDREFKSYDQIIEYLKGQDIMDALRNKDNPLYETLNNYVTNTNPHLLRYQDHDERIAAEGRGPVVKKLNKLLGKHQLQVTDKEVDAPMSLLLKELQNLTNKNYQPTESKTLVKVKKQ